MPRFKIHGFMFEPSSDGADKNGYIHFYDVVEAETQTEASDITYEDYGEYNTLEFHGEAKNKSDEKAWIARNPD
jgi:hypothetical protein